MKRTRKPSRYARRFVYSGEIELPVRLSPPNRRVSVYLINGERVSGNFDLLINQSGEIYETQT